MKERGIQRATDLIVRDKVRDTYVPPAYPVNVIDGHAAQLPSVPDGQHLPAQLGPQTFHITESSEMDSARAFAHVSLPVSFGFGLTATGIAIIGLAGGGVGLGWAAVWALVVLFVVFAGVQVYQLRKWRAESSAGVAYHHAKEGWEYLNREQAHRHERERRTWGD